LEGKIGRNKNKTNKMKYLIYAKIELEIEAENPQDAQKAASEKFAELEKAEIKITEARVVDKQSGYFVS